MRLKEFKPGMKVRCENRKELGIVLEEAERQGYLWATSGFRPTEYLKRLNEAIIHFGDNKRITWTNRAENTISFSELILPELTAEEVLKICAYICHANNTCNECPMQYNCYKEKDSDYEKIVQICSQWKADHEKKSPEFEWVDICRIIQRYPDGRKECVYEEDVTERELPFGELPERECENVLKKYISEHEGEYFAVASHVYRVKE